MKTRAILFFLVLAWFGPAAHAAREIKVIAAVSQSFKKNPEWEKEVRDRVLFVNELFEKSFGIHFTVEQHRAWDPLDEKRATSLLIEELRSAFKLGPDQIVIGFHRMSEPLGAEVMEDLDTVGTAQFFRGFVILRDPFRELPFDARRLVLAHEIGHLFGAVHVAGGSLLMNPSLPENPAAGFDADNAEIIRMTAAVDFREGPDSLGPAVLDALILAYEKLIRANPHSDFFYELGQFYKKRGLEARAVSVWEEALRRQYANPLIHRELGFYYYEGGRYDMAIQSLGSAVAHFVLPSQQKDRARAFNYLGVAYYEKGNIDQAKFNWLKGLAADPDDANLQANLAVAYLESGDIDRGIAELTKLAAKNPDDFTTLANLGIAHMKKGNFTEAARQFEAALQKKAAANPEKEKLIAPVPEAELRLNLGAAYLELGRLDDGVRELEKAAAGNPDSFEAHRNLAGAYLKKKDFPAAVREAEAAQRLKNDDPYPYVFLAQANAETGKPAEAVRYAQEALRRTQDDRLKAMLHRNIGLAHAQSGDLTRAAAEWRETLNLNWNDAETHMNLGILHLQAGRKEDARRSLETALRMDPKLEQAKKALESLRG